MHGSTSERTWCITCEWTIFASSWGTMTLPFHHLWHFCQLSLWISSRKAAWRVTLAMTQWSAGPLHWSLAQTRTRPWISWTCCTIHDEFAVEAPALEIFEIDLPSWKRRLYGIDSICTRRGGHLLAEWEVFEVSLSLNFERVLQGFLRQFEVGKKAGQYLVQHGEKKFLIQQIFVKRRTFESKCSFFEHKSFEKELLVGKCLLQKSMGPSVNFRIYQNTGMPAFCSHPPLPPQNTGKLGNCLTVTDTCSSVKKKGKVKV